MSQWSPGRLVRDEIYNIGSETASTKSTFDAAAYPTTQTLTKPKGGLKCLLILHVFSLGAYITWNSASKLEDMGGGSPRILPEKIPGSNQNDEINFVCWKLNFSVDANINHLSHM